MSSAKREQWLCHLCRSSVTKPTEESLDDSQMEPSSLSAQLEAVNEKIDVLKSSVDSLSQLPAKLDELLAVKSAVGAMEQSVHQVLESISFFSAQYDTLLKRVTESEATVAQLQSEVGSLKSSLSTQSEEIQRLQSEHNNSEQFGRRCNLEIHGLPCTIHENLPTVLGDIARSIGISDFHPSQIDAVHRLPSPRGAIPIILVRFRAVSTRDVWMRSRSSLGPLSREQRLPRLYFNEHLTPANKELFWKARLKGKEKQYRFVWVKNAKIYAKKTEDAPLVRINCVNDLELIV